MFRPFLELLRDHWCESEIGRKSSNSVFLRDLSTIRCPFRLINNVPGRSLVDSPFGRSRWLPPSPPPTWEAASSSSSRYLISQGRVSITKYFCICLRTSLKSLRGNSAVGENLLLFARRRRRVASSPPSSSSSSFNTLPQT